MSAEANMKTVPNGDAGEIDIRPLGWLAFKENRKIS